MRDSEHSHTLGRSQSLSHPRLASAGCSMAALAAILKSRPESAVGFVTSAPDARQPDTLSVAAPTLPSAAASPTESRGGPTASSVELKYSNSNSLGYLTNDHDLRCYDNIELPLEHYLTYTMSLLNPTLPFTYPYTHQLVTLGSRRSLHPTELPEACRRIVIPLKWQAWRDALVDHPDKQFTNYIVCGIREGFRIGYDYANYTTKARAGNMQSAIDNPGPVQEYLDKEIAAGRVVSVVEADQATVHTSKSE